MSNNVHDKIRKLLAMAEGQANEDESDNALRLATQLMMKHGIAQDDLDEEKVDAMAKRGSYYAFKNRWQLLIAQAAATLYGTAVLQRGKELSFNGRADNIGASEDTFAFLILQVEAMYKAALPKGMSKKERAEYRTSFKNSCALRVQHRAAEIVEEVNALPSSGTSLVIHRSQLKQEIDDLFSSMDIKKGRSLKIRRGSGTVDGRVAGDRVDLNRKVD